MKRADQRKEGREGKEQEGRERGWGEFVSQEEGTEILGFLCVLPEAPKDWSEAALGCRSSRNTEGVRLKGRRLGRGSPECSVCVHDRWTRSRGSVPTPRCSSGTSQSTSGTPPASASSSTPSPAPSRTSSPLPGLRPSRCETAGAAAVAAAAAAGGQREGSSGQGRARGHRETETCLYSDEEWEGEKERGRTKEREKGSFHHVERENYLIPSIEHLPCLD